MHVEVQAPRNESPLTQRLSHLEQLLSNLNEGVIRIDNVAQRIHLTPSGDAVASVAGQASPPSDLYSRLDVMAATLEGYLQSRHEALMRLEDAVL